MSDRVRGTFEVKLSPQPPEDRAEGASIGRLLIDKRFLGELEATSQGQMLASRSAFEGSAGYVAIEKVNGTLKGRSGSFVLQHSGTMNRGAPSLSIAVVPDSGTGELEGLSGTMTIEIADGVHSYEFEYSIDESR